MASTVHPRSCVPADMVSSLGSMLTRVLWPPPEQTVPPARRARVPPQGPPDGRASGSRSGPRGGPSKGTAGDRHGGSPLRVLDSDPWDNSDYGDGQCYLYETDVADDVYGACFVLSVHGLQDRKLGTVCMSVVWVVLNFFITVAVLYHLSSYVNPDSQINWQPDAFSSSRSFKEMVHRLTEAVNGTDPLRVKNPRDKELMFMCYRQPPVAFYFVIQLVWASRMLGQFAKAWHLQSMTLCCPIVEIRQFTVNESGGNMTVMGLLPFDSLFFGIILVLPRAVLAFHMWRIGSEHLAFARNFFDLIFRAVALHYTTTIERQIFLNFVAHSKKNWFRRTTVLQERKVGHWVLISWPGEFLKLVTVACLLLWTHFRFSRVTMLRGLCTSCKGSCQNSCVFGFDHMCPVEETGPLDKVFGRLFH